MSAKTLIIDFLRHGQIAELTNAYIGHRDIALSTTGLNDMQQQVKHRDYQQIISSPLRRCAGFAKELAQQRNIPLYLDESFKEINFGLFEGKTAQTLLQDYKQQVEIWWQDIVYHSPPEGESLIQLQQRVMPAFMSLLQQSNHQSHLLFVGHGGVIRLIINQLLNMPLAQLFSLQTDRGSLSQVRISYQSQDKLQTTLVFLNQPTFQQKEA